MFNLSWTELLVVAVVMILVVGPKELPGMLRAFGKTVGQVRRHARDFQNQFNDVLREAERQADLEDVRKGIDEVRSLDPKKRIGDAITGTQEPGKAAGAGGSAEKPAASTPSASHRGADAAGEAAPGAGDAGTATPAGNGVAAGGNGRGVGAAAGTEQAGVPASGGDGDVKPAADEGAPDAERRHSA